MRHDELLIVLDFGAQYTQLISRRVRALGVFSEILPYDVAVERVRSLHPIGIILSGGPSSVYDADAPKPNPELYALGVPILGICYGLQLIAHQLGGVVDSAARREYGQAELMVDRNEDLLEGLGGGTSVWMSHGDSLKALPEGFETIAHSANAPICAIRDTRRRIYGVQFHPEVVHTKDGNKILSNFMYRICGAMGGWTPSSFVAGTAEDIKRRVGSDRVLCALSGGVDSSVLAVLLHRAIGDRLQCVHIDNGLMRKGESARIVATFRDTFRIPLSLRDGSSRFLANLKGVLDPEEKRKVIGRTFVELFEVEARALGGEFKFLAQGTLYPDVVESAAAKGPTKTIKTHHNVGGLPKNMKFQLLEPFRDLFKDEVRRIGRELGVPEWLIGRHPFPGPGLSVRILGEITEERLTLLREADSLYVDEVTRAGLYDDIWQAFAVLLPVRSVGVMGDGRTYDYTIALRAVTSADGMTADWARLPHDLLARVSSRITNELRGINRVVYDVSSKPPATIEWE